MLEYMYVTYENSDNECAEEAVSKGATEMAQRGWKLVSVIRTVPIPDNPDYDDTLTAFFERRKPQRKKRTRR